VKHEQNIDCGGGYVKLFASDLDQTNMHGESPYNIMFGKLVGYSYVFLIYLLYGKSLAKVVSYNMLISDLAKILCVLLPQ